MDVRKDGKHRRRFRVRSPGGPPPGPARPGFWRSPLRGPWLTAVFGLVLLVGVPVMFVTGLLSYAAYNPDLARINDETPGKGVLGFYLFSWPTSPYWIYRVTQGIHVTLGIVLVPVLLAKLWSVVPRLFAWPPLRSPAHALERLSLLLLVGGVLFQFATGILNIQLEYLFPGSFYTLHFYGAWVLMGAFTVHVALRLPAALRAVRGRRAETGPPPAGESAAVLVTPRPAAPTMSRRGAVALVGVGSGTLLAVTVGQSVGGPFRRTAVLAPHGQEPGTGPNGFQINKTAASLGIRPSDTGPGWRLTVDGGGRRVVLTLDELRAMRQHESALPIACVEGWSTPDQLWRGCGSPISPRWSDWLRTRRTSWCSRCSGEGRSRRPCCGTTRCGTDAPCWRCVSTVPCSRPITAIRPAPSSRGLPASTTPNGSPVSASGSCHERLP